MNDRQRKMQKLGGETGGKDLAELPPLDSTLRRPPAA
jgi:hypothetical protein